MSDATDKLIEKMLGDRADSCDREGAWGICVQGGALCPNCCLHKAQAARLRKLFEYDGDVLEPIEDLADRLNLEADEAMKLMGGPDLARSIRAEEKRIRQALAESPARVAVIEADHSEKLQVMLDQFHRQDRECALMEAENTDLRAELKGLEIKAKNLCCAYGNLLMDFKELVRRKEFVAGVTQHMGQHEPAITVEEIEAILKKHKEAPDATKTKVEEAGRPAAQ